MNTFLSSSRNFALISTALIAVGLALIHLFSKNLRFPKLPRSRWLSGAGGVSVAYVFEHIMPELSEHQAVLEESSKGFISFFEHHVYLLALLGLTAFYGLEKMATESRDSQEEAGKGDVTTQGVFWVHIASFAIYNALIGYLLMHREEPDIKNLLLYSLAMALHFVVNDFGLRENHKHIYDYIGRWILAAAVIVGWAIGSGTQIGETAIAVLFAFLAGGIVLNVLKEELPEERESRFWAFGLGVAVYSVLLLAL
jgi:zinc transporter ZupT